MSLQDAYSSRDYNVRMRSLFTDTNPEMEALQIRLWREASPAQKLHMVGELYAAARELARAGLRERFPEATEEEIRRRLADLILGEALAEKVYGVRANDE